jgi:hypothetical protein
MNTNQKTQATPNNKKQQKVIKNNKKSPIEETQKHKTQATSPSGTHVMFTYKGAGGGI